MLRTMFTDPTRSVLVLKKSWRFRSEVRNYWSEDQVRRVSTGGLRVLCGPGSLPNPGFSHLLHDTSAVSYTHLDVYKRQVFY